MSIFKKSHLKKVWMVLVVIAIILFIGGQLAFYLLAAGGLY